MSKDEDISTAANGTIHNTSFWNVNLPTSLHTEKCPTFLAYAFTNTKDRGILCTRDSDYHRQTWSQVQQFIHDNRLDLFERLPSDLRRYREYCDKLVKEYGTVMAFVMEERLKWSDLTPRGEPFAEAGKHVREIITISNTDRQSRQKTSKSSTMTGLMALTLGSSIWSFGPNSNYSLLQSVPRIQQEISRPMLESRSRTS